jgi:transposase
MPRYKPVNLQQDAFVPISFAKQILPGTFEFALHHLLEQIDLSAFDAAYANDKAGARAYHPKVLLKIVLFAYSKGVLGSRRIEALCREHIVCMALSGESMPDHATIAAFISRSPAAIRRVFQEVLLVCDQAGLIGRKMFAIDGVKLPSNASKEGSGTFEELKARADKFERAVERMLAAHADADTRPASPDLLAQQRQQIETLQRHTTRIRNYLAGHQPKRGPKGTERKSNITDPDSAKLATSKGVIQGYTGVAIADADHQVIVEAQAHGVPQEQELLAPILDDLRDNFQDLDLADNILAEAKLTADAGYHSEANLAYLAEQGCDAYIADNQFRKRDPRFAQADKYKRAKAMPKRFRPQDFDYDPHTLRCTCPAGKALYRNGANVTIQGRSGIKFTAPKSACKDCALRARCLKDAQQKTPRQVVFFHDPDPGHPSHTARMKVKIDSAHGRGLYAYRLGTVEPVFGNIRHTKGMDSFTLRGRAKVNGQFQLYCLVHNIEKLAHSGWARAA